MSDDSEHEKPTSEPSPPVSKQAGRVSTDEHRHNDDDDDERPEAGFDLNLSPFRPSFRAWGGKAELYLIIPFLKWLAVGALALWGALELLRNQ